MLKLGRYWPWKTVSSHLNGDVIYHDDDDNNDEEDDDEDKHFISQATALKQQAT